MEHLSLAEYSRRIGVSRAAVSQMKKAGKLVLTGDGRVDAIATDARLKMYRRDGLRDVDPSRQSVKRGRPVKQDDVLNTAEPVRLTRAEVMERIVNLDWVSTPDWSLDAQERRAQLAAQCVGWEAVQSDKADDGHFGGWQLRTSRFDEKPWPQIDSVIAGFGFELDLWDVVTECRAELEPIDGDDDDEVTVRIDLLPLLAHPFSEYDRPR